ncbi:hypothetical protein MLD38_012678 [Melastoma candidum]|uniref:Uncharacterized protein n=1 Tax=Melastoma candidum TaxID=119954 RepID=A0ACB9R738_9MYRT|nr:hypothetical protein MLD38_012678 [Melastoma candidum]
MGFRVIRPQRPVLNPCMAIGFLTLPDGGLRVGQLITVKWRIERLKDLKETDNLGKLNDEILYEVIANS